MKFSQVAKVAQVTALLNTLEKQVGDIDMNQVKKDKVLATVAKLKTDFMDGAGIEADTPTLPSA
jgi:hypothetical protein